MIERYIILVFDQENLERLPEVVGYFESIKDCKFYMNKYYPHDNTWVCMKKPIFKEVMPRVPEPMTEDEWQEVLSRPVESN